MIPLRDDISTNRFPIITILLIMANAAVFIYTDILGLGGKEFFLHYAAIPINISSLGAYSSGTPLSAIATIFTSQFLHGGLFHIGGNMLFLDGHTSWRPFPDLLPRYDTGQTRAHGNIVFWF